MALRAQRISIGLVRAGQYTVSSTTSLLSETPHRALCLVKSMKGQREEEKFKETTAALYRDGALSEVGLPYQDIEKYSLALLGFPLSLSDDVA